MTDQIYKHVPNFVSDKETKRKFISFLESLPYTRPNFKIFGKQCKSPRDVCFIGNCDNTTYSYSGISLQTIQWDSELIDPILEKIKEITGEDYNCALVNKYVDNNDYIGFHKDNEKELLNKNIVSLTFGQERRFIIKNAEEKHEIKIKDGDLVVMTKNCNRNYYHGIPKEKKALGTRYNMTFRRV